MPSIKMHDSTCGYLELFPLEGFFFLEKAHKTKQSKKKINKQANKNEKTKQTKTNNKQTNKQTDKPPLSSYFPR